MRYGCPDGCTAEEKGANSGIWGQSAEKGPNIYTNYCYIKSYSTQRGDERGYRVSLLSKKETGGGFW